MDKFQSFLEQLWDVDNAPLIESIQSAYGAIFEAKILPEIAPASDDNNIGYHEYSVDGGGDKRIYSVGTVNKRGENIIMDIQVRKLPQQVIGNDYDSVWLVNFVQRGQTDFNVTNEGTLDSFNSTFAAIKMFLQSENPDAVYYKATDDDPAQAAKKKNIYRGYFKNLGYLPVAKEDLTSQPLKAGEVAAR